MGYLHVEVVTAQTAKKPGAPCGDLVSCDRSETATNVICCDGIGSGVKASIAAELHVSRLRRRLASGASARESFAGIIRTLHEARGTEAPYACLALARVRANGSTTVLSYEMPAPIFIRGRHATLPRQHVAKLGSEIVAEANLHLNPGDGLLLLSDGITQAGLGSGLAEGWTVEGVCSFVSEQLAEGVALRDIPKVVHRQAQAYWLRGGDDCTAALACCREGVTLNLLTGPPSSPALDQQVAREFLDSDGFKVVCGASTAKLVALEMGVKPEVRQDENDLLAPPSYAIRGLDLVTEGAVSLNQVYNVLDEDRHAFAEKSGVTELHDLLRMADQVRFLVGVATNPANESISFRQHGILSRTRIVPLLAEKLREAGKLVTVKYF